MKILRMRESLVDEIKNDKLAYYPPPSLPYQYTHTETVNLPHSPPAPKRGTEPPACASCETLECGVWAEHLPQMLHATDAEVVEVETKKKRKK